MSDLGDILYEAHAQELLSKVALAPRGPEPTFAGLGSLPVYRWDEDKRELVKADPAEPLLDKIEDNLRSIQQDLELIRTHMRRDR